MMKELVIIITVLLFSTCVSVDVNKRVKPQEGVGKEKSGGSPEIIVAPIDTGPPEVIEVERPVYVPAEAARSGASHSSGTAAVESAMPRGILKPENFSHAAVIYDYDDDWVYEVYCQPMRATDIRLQNSERIAEPPFISDSERWKIGAGVSYENGEAVQHVYVKPDEQNTSASLIINTDRRVYHIILRSYSAERNIHMPKVRWRYPGNPMPRNYISANENGNQMAGGGAGAGEPDAGFSADPRFLSFNYRITYPLFGKPRWMPELAYDDGKKTYITFPEEALQAELPAVFEDRDKVVNYRVARNVIIIDKLIEAVTVKIGKKQVIVGKKKGKS